MGDRFRAGMPSRYLTSQLQVDSVLLFSVVAKSSTSLIWLGKGGNVTSAGWQVTLNNPTWHLSFRYTPDGHLSRTAS